MGKNCFNVWLDDVRPAPNGWVWVKTPKQAIRLLVKGGIDQMSFDHDLGEDYKTGYDVLKWLEEEVHFGRISPPKCLLVHSANPVGVKNMQAAINSIRRMIKST